MCAKSTCAIGVLILLVSMVHTLPVHAQATAAIFGTVADPTGAVIGGAQVQVKNTGTGYYANRNDGRAGPVSLPGNGDRRI
jgi:hypothetical protein